jgi:hypothetical protein
LSFEQYESILNITISIPSMPSLGPREVSFSTHFGYRKFQESLHTDRHVIDKCEEQEGNQPERSRSAIQVSADAHLEEGREVADEAVKGNGHRKPEHADQPGSLEKE